MSLLTGPFWTISVVRFGPVESLNEVMGSNVYPSEMARRTWDTRGVPERYLTVPLTQEENALLREIRIKAERVTGRDVPATELVRAWIASGKHPFEPLPPKTNPGADAARLIRQRARELLASAVSSGAIVKATACASCGAEGNIYGHHTDYANPLEVLWLCRACHGSRHAEDSV